MTPRNSYLVAAGLLLSLLIAALGRADDDLHCIAADAGSGSSGAVRVGAVCLTHTEQAMALDKEGKLIGGDVAEQLKFAMRRLEAAGHQTGAGLDRCVKLNVYLRNSDDLPAVQDALAKRFATDHKPAVTYVTTDLPLPDALVAVDAVIATPRQPRPGVEVFPSSPVAAACAVLPPGGRVYIAGQAEQGDLATATRKTMESLRKTLEDLRLDYSHVVQIKSFVMPMSDSATAEREIRACFAEQKSPPLVFVQWQSGTTTPIEIELIATAPSDRLPPSPPAVEYITPPGMTSSPVFARVTRVASPRTIYVSGLYGDKSDAEGQVRGIFAQLDKLLKPAGGDLKHLVKATYYVADEPVSAMLNKLRPEYYDPQRPPAASKAPVRGVGRKDRTVTLDMIAVPAE